MANGVHREELATGRLRRSDVVLLLGLLVAAMTPALILLFARSENVAILGIIWGWIVNLSIWIYQIVSAI